MLGIDRRIAWGLIAGAVLARAAAVLVLQSHTVPHSTFEHGEIAANLLAGRGFSVRFLGAEGPTSQQALAYPLVVAAAYAVGGVGTPRALLLLQMGQALLGGLLVVAVLALAREVASGRRALAIVAGAVAALHPTLVYAATHVQAASLTAVLPTAALAFAYRAGRAGLPRDAIACGLLLALAMLTDPILGLAFPASAWAMARGDQPRSRAARLAGVAGLTAALAVAPWIARNYWVHGELVLIKSTFGYAFWQGNCALSQGTDKVVRPTVEEALSSPGGDGGLRGWNETLWKARHTAGYLDDIALTADDYRTLGALTEPERSRVLFRRALADLKADPWRYPTLCLRRLRYFVFWDDTNPKTRSLIYRAGQLGLTAFAAFGLLMLGPEPRRRLAPTLLFALLLATFHILTIVSARFHVPVEPLMGLWGACGLPGGWSPTKRTHTPHNSFESNIAVFRLSSSFADLRPDCERPGG